MHVERFVIKVTRETAIRLIKFYSQKPPLYNKLFCDWLGINHDSLDFIVDNLKIKI